MKPIKTTKQVSCQTEYDKLQTVMVCPPYHMRIDKVINQIQEHYKDKNIDRNKAVRQHREFVRLLKEQGTEVLELPPVPELNEQVFTRDIGFCVGDQLLIAKMDKKIREEETQVLERKLDEQGMSYHHPFQSSIEGGDVIIDKEKIWVGISKRTSMGAVETLRASFPFMEIIPLPIDNGILHLDCAFNVIAPGVAIAYPAAFSEKSYGLLQKHYQLIEISSTEQFFMGTNVLATGEGKVVSLPQNKRINLEMSRMGLEVLEIDLSEIIKSGGSFRCCSLPLYRKDLAGNEF